MKPVSLIAAAFLGVISLAHLPRLALGLEVQIGRTQVPLWMSGVAFLFCGILAALLYREGRQH